MPDAGGVAADADSADPDTVQYLQQHRVAELLSTATACCAQERPDQPIQWLAGYLSDRAGSAGASPNPSTRAVDWLQETGVSDSVSRAVTQLAAAQPRPADPCAWLAEAIAREAGSAPERGPRKSGIRAPHIDISASPVASNCDLAAEMDSNRRASIRSSPRSVTWAPANNYRLGDDDDGEDEDGPEDEFEQTMPAPSVEVMSKTRAVDDALDMLRSHLLGTAWTDIYDGIEEWVEKRRKEPQDEGPCLSVQPLQPREEEEAKVEGQDEPEPVEERGGKCPAGAAQGLQQVLTILHSTMVQRATRGAIQVELQANTNTPDSTVGVAELVKQLKGVADSFDDKAIQLSFQNFPVRRRRDEYREITTETHVLMLAKLSVEKPKGPRSKEQCFEVFVNLVGHCVYKQVRKKGFDHFDVIPSFGQLVNVIQIGQHKSLCGPDAVVRCSKIIEALHHFKLALVRIAEHMIQSVIQGEFLTDIARRMSEVNAEALFDPEKEQRRRSLPPALPVYLRRRGTQPPVRQASPRAAAKEDRRRSAPPAPGAAEEAAKDKAQVAAAGAAK